MPELLEYLWKWFLRLSKRRGSGFGPAPLSHTGIKDFFTLIKIEPTPWEIEQIEQLDDVYLKIRAEEAEANKPAT